MSRRSAPPTGAKRTIRKTPVGEMIMNHMGIKAAESVDFDAIDKLLAEPAKKESVQLQRVRERTEEEDRIRGLQALLLENPDDVLRLEMLALSYKKLERTAELLGIYKRLQALQPQRSDLPHMIAALSGEARPARASDDYVRKEFDGFAENFDSTLSTWLEYRAPQLVCDAVKRALPAGELTQSTIDLGCGTGLAAPLLRAVTRRLEGVDLSPRMLDKARARGGYDALHEGEIGKFLEPRRGQYTLAVACDVFCYFGELEPTFRQIHAALKPGGLFAFTVERRGGDGFELQVNGRYAHSDAFVLAAGAAAGLELLRDDEVTLRTELHKPVIGGCYLFRRP
jgi:predicted TPR repeat methyltransferase